MQRITEEKIPESDKIYFELIKKEFTNWLSNKSRLTSDGPRPIEKPSYYLDMILNDSNCLKHLSNIAMALIHLRIAWEVDKNSTSHPFLFTDIIFKNPQFSEEIMDFIIFDTNVDVYPDADIDNDPQYEKYVKVAIATSEILKTSPGYTRGKYPLEPDPEVLKRIELAKSEQKNDDKAMLVTINRRKTTDDIKNPYRHFNNKRNSECKTTDDLMEMKKNLKR